MICLFPSSFVKHLYSQNDHNQDLEDYLKLSDLKDMKKNFLRAVEDKKIMMALGKGTDNQVDLPVYRYSKFKGLILVVNPFREIFIIFYDA